ncbi:MAG: hypothetical protein FWH04_09700 [Oscillospiraceae bacterium]|nr:hypothetical protein [Oscillospiraceae bacterium]
MKKRVFAITMVIMMMVSFVSVPVLAAFTDTEPSSPGLFIAGVGYDERPSMDNDYHPIRYRTILPGNNATATTVTIPKTSNFILFGWWRRGTFNGHTGSNLGYISASETFHINNTRVYGIGGGTDQHTEDFNRAIRSQRKYITFPADRFSKTNGEVFEIRTSYMVGVVRHSYTATYTINWSDPADVTPPPAAPACKR